MRACTQWHLHSTAWHVDWEQYAYAWNIHNKIWVVHWPVAIQYIQNSHANSNKSKSKARVKANPRKEMWTSETQMPNQSWLVEWTKCEWVGEWEVPKMYIKWKFFHSTENAVAINQEAIDQLQKKTETETKKEIYTKTQLE